MEQRFNNRGQVTIFIIIGVVIVISGILVYMFYPQIKSSLGLTAQSPGGFIQSCMEEDIEEIVKQIASQGGSLNPEHYIIYDDANVEYLCYTNEYYKTCVVQQPALKQHIESELKSEIGRIANSCFQSLKESYQKKGYEVKLGIGDQRIELLPERIIFGFDNTLTLTKGETQEYESFEVILNNNLYELISIANSIIEWEITYGDAETTTYMNYYKDIKVEKKKQTDGSTIYIIADRNTENKFQFASRSVAWPPGYGAGE